MFGSEIVDVAIGLTFIFSILSVICSALAELLEGLIKKRASELEAGVRNLLADPQGTAFAQKIYDHPLVRSLFRGEYSPPAGRKWLAKRSLPSYIPRRNFALALLDAISAASPAIRSGAHFSMAVSPITETSPGERLHVEKQQDASIDHLRNEVSALAEGDLKTALLALIDAAGGDMRQIRRNIEDWYDSAMDRVAGWYKRYAQVILFFLGIALAMSLNIDPILIGRYLSSSKSARESLVAAAQQYAQENAAEAPDTGGDRFPPPPTHAREERETQFTLAKLELRNVADTTTQQSRIPCDSPACRRVQENLQAIESLSLPMGWGDSGFPGTIPKGPIAWVIRGLGWLLTAAAVSLGAPFWFDVLNKFVVVRSTVKPREKSPEEPSKA